MNKLFAPWRKEYLYPTKPAEAGCIFCTLPTQGLSEETLILRITPHAFTIMNRYPYTNGHVMVVPRAHVNALEGLAPEAFAELHAELLRAVTAVKGAYKPHGLNLGMNLGRAAGAGIDEHLHWHVVPRWNGDTNFMPVVGEARVISESLLSSYRALKAQL